MEGIVPSYLLYYICLFSNCWRMLQLMVCAGEVPPLDIALLGVSLGTPDSLQQLFLVYASHDAFHVALFLGFTIFHLGLLPLCKYGGEGSLGDVKGKTR